MRISRLAAVAATASIFVIGAAQVLAAPAFGADTPKSTTVAIASAKPASGSVVVNGGTLVLAGTTSRNLAGSRVAVQVFRSNRWVATPSSAKVAGDDTYRARVLVAVGRPGKYRYRVVFGGSSRLARSEDERTVRVWAWFALANQTPVKYDYSCCGDLGDGGIGTDTQTVAGKTYRNTMWQETGSESPTYEEFNLGYHCLTFTTIVGLDDSNDSSASGTAVVSTDGATRLSQALSLGHGYQLSMNVKGVFRIHLELDADNGVLADWPTAALLCSQNP